MIERFGRGARGNGKGIHDVRKRGKGVLT